MYIYITSCTNKMQVLNVNTFHSIFKRKYKQKKEVTKSFLPSSCLIYIHINFKIYFLIKPLTKN